MAHEVTGVIARGAGAHVELATVLAADPGPGCGDVGRGGALRSSWYGDCLPDRVFPMLTSLHLAGRLPLEKFVSETIPVDGVEEAFARLQRGEVLRSVVTL